MLGSTPKGTKKQGRPTSKPRRVTVTLSAHHGDQLDRMAEEASVTISALCAHILERYAVQDKSLMNNDSLALRLEQQAERHAAHLEKRFGDLLMRVAHETVAHRRQSIIHTKADEGEEAAKTLAELGWSYAVKSLRPYQQSESAEAGE